VGAGSWIRFRCVVRHWQWGHSHSRLIAREIGAHVDTIRRWRLGIDLPEARFVGPLVAALYALRLYWVRRAPPLDIR
jgi:hypothetical protein